MRGLPPTNWALYSTNLINFASAFPERLAQRLPARQPWRSQTFQQSLEQTPFGPNERPAGRHSVSAP